MPTSRHLCSRQYWQRFRVTLLMIQLFSLWQVYTMFFWMLLRKKPWGVKQALRFTIAGRFTNDTHKQINTSPQKSTRLRKNSYIKSLIIHQIFIYSHYAYRHYTQTCENMNKQPRHRYSSLTHTHTPFLGIMAGWARFRFGCIMAAGYYLPVQVPRGSYWLIPSGA